MIGANSNVLPSGLRMMINTPPKSGFKRVSSVSGISLRIFREGPQNGLYLPKTAYGSGFPSLRIDDYQNNSSRSSNELRMVTAPEELLDKYRLSLDDLVINRLNGPSHLGKCLKVADRNLPAIFESNMMRYIYQAMLMFPLLRNTCTLTSEKNDS
jgi:hypothetical protein